MELSIYVFIISLLPPYLTHSFPHSLTHTPSRLPQVHRVASRVTGSDGRGLPYLPDGHVLPVSVTLPPSAARHPTLEEPEEEDQGEEQTGGQTALLRHHNTQE